MISETFLSIILGIGLAASVGFRVFVPLFVLSLASFFDVIPLNESWEWMGSMTALLTFGIATFLEITAYLVPWLDHFLDAITLPLAGLAGTAVMISTLTNMDPFLGWTLAIIAGGGTATVVKTTSASTRLASTTTSAGVANPIISTMETGTSIGMSILAVFFPIIAILFFMLMIWTIYKVIKVINSNL